MATVNLDDLLQAKHQTAQTTSPVATPAQEIKEVTQQTEALTPEEQQKVAAIRDGIDLMDAQTSIQFGAQAQRDIAEFSDSILANIRSKDSGYVGDLLSSLVVKVKGFDAADDGGFLKKIPLIGSLVSSAEHKIAAYDKVSVQVDKIQGELDKARTTMLKDIVMFDTMYDKNLEYFKTLQLYIVAGEEKLHELQTVTIPQLRAQAAQSKDPMAVQVVSDFENAVNRFEKKVHDLKLSKTIAIQTAPQIRLIQNNDKVLVDKVQSAIYNTIPLWKSQMVIALGLSRQQQVLQMQRDITDTTNALLQKNAEMLKQNTVETARENERGIVDIDTLKKVNGDLIATIEETIKIQQEGRAKRQAAETELATIEDQLKQTLLAHIQRPDR